MVNSRNIENGKDARRSVIEIALISAYSFPASNWDVYKNVFGELSICQKRCVQFV